MILPTMKQKLMLILAITILTTKFSYGQNLTPTPTPTPTPYSTNSYESHNFMSPRDCAIDILNNLSTTSDKEGQTLSQAGTLYKNKFVGLFFKAKNINELNYPKSWNSIKENNVIKFEVYETQNNQQQKIHISDLYVKYYDFKYNDATGAINGVTCSLAKIKTPWWI